MYLAYTGGQETHITYPVEMSHPLVGEDITITFPAQRELHLSVIWSAVTLPSETDLTFMFTVPSHYQTI